jgi:hypothetical protein
MTYVLRAVVESGRVANYPNARIRFTGLGSGHGLSHVRVIYVPTMQRGDIRLEDFDVTHALGLRQNV